MKKVKLELPAPHSAQRQVIEESARFNVLACGRRWGKTTLGVDRLIEPALKGKPAAWFAPIYRSLTDVWRAMEQTLKPVISRSNLVERRFELTTGGLIECWALDENPDACRGRAYATVVIDEAAKVRDLEGTWQQVIRPLLTDHEGSAWFLSTPRGQDYFARLYDRGQDPERPDWKSWQMATTTNPFIAASEIEAARQDLTESAFAQEYLANFVNWEGAVFRKILDAATAEPKDGPEDGHSYIIGADWGRSVDYTVFCVLDITARTMVAVDRSNRVDYEVQRGRLNALHERWKPSVIICEANSIGQPVIEQLVRDGLPVKPFTTSNSSKAQIIEALALAFERSEITILNNPTLIGELQAFQSERLPGGLMRYAAPAGGHDDMVIALAIAWQGVLKDKKKLVIPPLVSMTAPSYWRGGGSGFGGGFRGM